MNCPNCGTYNDPQSKICIKCGNALNTENFNQPNQLNENINSPQNYEQPQMQQSFQNQNDSNNKKPINGITIIIIIILLIAIGGGLFYFSTKDKKSKKSEVENNTSQIIENENENSAGNNSANLNSSVDNEEQNDIDDNSNNTTGSVDPNTNINYDENGAFLMPIQDIFTDAIKGTTVTGFISRGKVKVGDKVQIIGLDQEIKTAVVAEVVAGKKEGEATINDNAIIVLHGITRNEMEIGQVLATPNSIIAAKKFEADIYVLSEDEGGKTLTFAANYTPQFRFGTIDIQGTATLLNGVEKVNPAEKAKLSIELTRSVAMDVGREFTIRENGQKIAYGKITKVN